MFKKLKKEKIRCPGGFVEDINAIRFEKMPQMKFEPDKNPKKNQNLKNFMQFLFVFRKTRWLGILKTINKEQIRCPGGFC